MKEIDKKLYKEISKNIYYAYKHPPYLLERKLIAAIQLGNTDVAIATLDEINQLERATLAKSPLSSLKYSLVASCTLFTRGIVEIGIDPEKAFALSDLYIGKIDETNTIQNLQELEYDMMLAFIRLAKRNKQHAYNSTVNRAISFIKDNIEENPTVAEIAIHVNVHPNYLTALFKKEVGISLSTFVTRYKVERIKQLLQYTATPLHEIATLFHFSSQAHLSTFFKKTTGFTPSAYRNLYSLL
ncbi:MAG: helix-turn-helix transcriptional regulator [Bacillaceae bacterium]